ncbi:MULTISPECIES: RagB/SusD family nutrient uptake outer membrane protein [Sphingobacterium]|uniref:RagB/SusD family nutrient uptake outer membrane protein n=1 Tax=Sphingobacterium TaxID=28453 RepID=UPI0013DBC7CC|nr:MULTISPECIES: RagB/SusD family nutrient uptake outer membrane protein [unclassified Sphingobacterium]
MKYLYSLYIALGALMFTSCQKFLDRPELTELNDETAWTTEENVRLYATKFYDQLFKGYGKGFDNDSTLLLGNIFNDNVLQLGRQTEFTRAVPVSSIWHYGTIRSLNVMINRVEGQMKNVLNEESFNHWTGVGRFFRGLRYSDLVFKFGDIPYYDQVIGDKDYDQLYKDRTPRNEVMDGVYEDLKYAMDNVRLNDGAQNVNRYIVAGFVSRIALMEGTWQKYYYNNNERAKRFLELGLTAAEFVINSGRYDITMDYRSQFTSEDLRGVKDVLLYRQYDEVADVRHTIISLHNLAESVNYGPTTDLVKSYVCTDGTVWQNSAVADADDFTTTNLFKTRDSRFEASFHDKPTIRNKASLLYITKFLPREVEARVAAGGAPGIEYSGTNNTTDAPILRYAEVLLNWIEIKAELATLGGAAVSQSDLDNSINKIRDRPLAPEAVAKGVTKTADLTLGTLPIDPQRDVTVTPLLWEIRRERRMEMLFEHSRLEDLKRWSKLAYMDTKQNPDLLSGGWVNFKTEMPANELKTGVSVVKLNGQIEVFNSADPNSGDKMIGFYRYVENTDRQPFLNQSNVNPYLAPVGRNQINEYKTRGYVLSQTEGWGGN